MQELYDPFMEINYSSIDLSREMYDQWEKLERFNLVKFVKACSWDCCYPALTDKLCIFNNNLKQTTHYIN